MILSSVNAHDRYTRNQRQVIATVMTNYDVATNKVNLLEKKVSKFSNINNLHVEEKKELKKKSFWDSVEKWGLRILCACLAGYAMSK
jgi:hypothetical protein